eukprot:9337-Heterococcus_DN1.PRE.8
MWHSATQCTSAEPVILNAIAHVLQDNETQDASVAVFAALLHQLWATVLLIRKANTASAFANVMAQMTHQSIARSAMLRLWYSYAATATHHPAHALLHCMAYSLVLVLHVHIKALYVSEDQGLLTAQRFS